MAALTTVPQGANWIWTPPCDANGLPLSANNSDSFRVPAANGLMFTSTTGKQTSGGAITTGLSLFNPALSGKTLYVLSIRLSTAAGALHQLNLTTVDPVLTTGGVINNNKPGGAVSIANMTFQNTAVTASGTQFSFTGSGGNTTGQFLDNGVVIVLPPGNGFLVLVSTSTNNWHVEETHFEQ